MQTLSFRLLVHDACQCNPSELLDKVVRIDPGAQIRRKWESALELLHGKSPMAVDLIIDIFNGPAYAAIERLGNLQQIRRRYNYSPIPLYLAISTCKQKATTRRVIRNAGGHFLYMAHVSEYLDEEMEEIQLELAELKLNLPQWEIAEEGESPRKRAYVNFLFRGRQIRVKGSDLESAVLAVMLGNNRIARTFYAWTDLLANDPLFEPAGGIFSVPSPRVLKAYIDQRFEEYIQEAFDEVKSGYSVKRIIEHVKLGSKAVAYKIHGRVQIKKETFNRSLTI